jgi:hypothetical protein
MSRFKKYIEYLGLKPIHFLGAFLVLGVPIFHNLHNFLFSYLANLKVEYYKNGYYFAITILHSIAPALGLIGCIWLPKKLKGFLIVPIAYEIYKAVEKIPSLRKDYSIYQEYWILSAFFVLAFLPLGYFFYKPKVKLTPKEEKEAEKGLESIKNFINLK